MSNKSTSQQSKLLPVILIALGAVMVLGILVYQAIRSVPTAQTPPVSTAPPSTDQENPALTVERVSLEESKAAFDDQTAVFLDVRDPSSYDSGHIPGAVNIPLGDLEARASELSQDDWIITYCT